MKKHGGSSCLKALTMFVPYPLNASVSFQRCRKKTLSFALKIFRYNHKVDSLSLAISGFQNGQSTHRIACEEADSWLAVVNAMTLNEVNM